jgi:hypothetical protein
MTDLRELLREATNRLREWPRDSQKCAELIALIEAALAQPPDAKPDNYVAWMRWNGHTWITCDSDAKGAFRVYRWSAPQPPAAKGEIEPFVVKHYSSDERPIIKGNGFDGLEVGEDRDEAEHFIQWLNPRLGFPASEAIPREIHERLLAEKDAEIERLRLAIKIASDPDDDPSAGIVEPMSEIDIACRDITRAMQGRIDDAVQRAEAAERALARAQEALRFIEAWQLPRVTYKDFIKVNKGEATEPDIVPCSYGTAYGSSGERDYMRNVARIALASEHECE